MTATEVFDRAMPGETYWFHYNGGSEGAGYRLGQFHSSDDGPNGRYIDVWDLHKQGHRRFIVSKIGDTYRVARPNEECVLPKEFIAVNTEKLASNTIIDVYKALHSDSKGVRWDDQAKCVVFTKPEEPQVSIDIYGTQVRIRFTNRESQILDLRFQAGQNIGVASIGCKLTENDAKKFATALFDHFNYEMANRPKYYSRDLNLSDQQPQIKESAQA